VVRSWGIIDGAYILRKKDASASKNYLEFDMEREKSVLLPYHFTFIWKRPAANKFSAATLALPLY
jgi:hypothetical protein